MSWFRKSSEKEKLEKKYRKLINEAYELSHSDRKASDLKTAEADVLLKRIQELS